MRRGDPSPRQIGLGLVGAGLVLGDRRLVLGERRLQRLVVEAEEDVPGLDGLPVGDRLRDDDPVDARPDGDGSDRLDPADRAFGIGTSRLPATAVTTAIGASRDPRPSPLADRPRWPAVTFVAAWAPDRLPIRSACADAKPGRQDAECGNKDETRAVHGLGSGQTVGPRRESSPQARSCCAAVRR